MIRVKEFCLILFVFCALLAPQAFADAVYLNTGEILKGVVVEEYCDRIMLSTYKGEEEINKVSIDQIFFDNEEQNYAYLADKAFTEGNFDTASGLYLKALQINPGFSRAGDALSRLADAVYRKNMNIKPQDLKKQLGIEIERYKDNIRVKNVFKNSSADKSGVSTGDFITGAWDVSVKYMDAEEAAGIMTGAPGEPIKILIEKDIYLQVNPMPWFKKIFSFLFFNDYGFKFDLKTSGLEVSSVRRCGAADNSGLKISDEIIKINAESVRYMPVSMVRKKIFQSNSKALTLTIKRRLTIERK